MNSKSFFILTLCFAISLALNAQETGYFEDQRDRHNYKYVTIGEQVWMAENLSHRMKGSSVYYHGITDPDTIRNNEYFGRLYDFEAALKACPEGWHLPSDEEWTVLTEFLGGEPEAGGKMKTVGTTDDNTGLWNPPNKDATNESGFSGVPGGYRNSDGYCTASDHYGVYWSSTKKSSTRIWSRELTYQYGYLSRFPKDISHQNSVRCIKDME